MYVLSALKAIGSLAFFKISKEAFLFHYTSFYVGTDDIVKSFLIF